MWAGVKMTELKTLKDLEDWKNPNETWEGLKSLKQFRDELKKEAIKWVKEYGWRNPRVDVLVVFFNLTEEDLKGGDEDD